MTVISQLPRNFDIEVARGTVPGYENIRIAGVNPSVGDSFEDLWDAGGKFLFPTAGETWEVVSDNVNDISEGTGAKTLLITGLDDSYVEQSEVIAMNGTTPVTTTRTDWFRIRSVIVVSSGSGETNAGDITIRVSGGGDTRSLIRTGLSNTFNGFFTVPANKTLFVLNAQVLIPKNEDVVNRNRFKGFGTNTFLSGGDNPLYQNQGIAVFTSLPTLPQKTDFVVTSKSTNTSVSVSILIQGKLVDDEGSSIGISSF